MAAQAAFLMQRKGEKLMECKHEQIMCRNCVKICLKCGKELPADFGTNKPAPKATEAAETPVKAQKTTSRKKVK